MNSAELALSIKEKARQLDVYLGWLEAGRYAGMVYLAEKRAVERRSTPALILPDCRSILILGIPYSSPQSQSVSATVPGGRIAAYAWGADYHLVLPQRLQELVAFLEEQVGHPVPNRWYTDTGPILERDLAMRAGLGWIGKNTCLINPRHGSYFILAEILLGFDLPPDEPWTTDQCGSCSRCIVACPTNCILPDRTLDAARCISYLTIENKGGIPVDLRRLTDDWIFGCDICQMVCPWNIRFAQANGDPLFAPRPGMLNPVLVDEMALTPQEFNRKFKDSPLKRAKWRGYLRNVAIAAGNSGKAETLSVLEKSQGDSDPLVREAAQWAIGQVTKVTG
jgi:epoxyqueuosine reductase